METKLTAYDLVDFVLKNKGTKTFIDCTQEQIVYMIMHGIQKQSLFYHIEHNKIVGMILADRDDEKKTLFVTENLSMSLRVLKMFAKKAKEIWPDYALEWMKHGIHKKHNTNKLYSKLAI